jgi:hypothetical protein
MDIVVVILIVGVAAFFLYRHFTRSLRGGAPACGCEGCGAQAGNEAPACHNQNGGKVAQKPCGDMKAVPANLQGTEVHKP